MKRKFEISMVGELNYFLGLQVKQRKDGIFISQEKYAKNLFKRFGLDSKKHTSTPMSSLAKLSVDVAGVDIDPTLYQSMIGSLFYLTASRPDIAFSVGSQTVDNIKQETIEMVLTNQDTESVNESNCVNEDVSAHDENCGDVNDAPRVISGDVCDELNDLATSGNRISGENVGEEIRCA
nr:uncharacterized protein LOC112021037 [Quercus suber]